MATFNGTPKDDVIIGTGKSDRINAGAGNDIVDAGGGNDVVYASTGDDIVQGGNGNDDLYGEDGSDILSGGEGNDELSGGDGDDVLDGGADNDTIFAGSGNDRISLSLDNDFIDGSFGIDTIDGSWLNSGVSVNLLLGSATGSGVKTTFLGIENVTGTQHSDTITGDIFDNVLKGNGGNDRIYGGLGDDTLIAGGGQGAYYGESGNDTLEWTAGTPGSQLFDGGSGKDTVRFVLTSEQLSGSVAAELADYASAIAAKPGASYQFEAIGSLLVKGTEALQIIVDGKPADLDDIKNSAPVIDAQTVSHFEAAHSAIVDGTIIASDPDGDQLTFTLADAPEHGRVVLDTQTGRYVFQAGDTVGQDSFVVRVSDSRGGFTDHTIKINLTNQGPEISSDSDSKLSVAHGQQIAGLVAANDVDGDVLDYMLVSGPEHGLVSLNAATGKFVYEAGEHVGSDSFTVRVSDGFGGYADHTVAVELTNTGPVVLPSSDNTLSVVHGQSVAGNVDAEDADGDNYSFSIATGPSHGTIVFTDDSGSYVYEADDYVGEDSFTVRVSDGFGGFADQIVKVQSTNTGPAIDAQASTGFYSAMYGSSVSGAIVAFDTDGDTVTFTLKSGPQGGHVTVDADGRFVFEAEDRAGTDSFTVTASDGYGGSVDHEISFGVIGTLDASDAATAINVNLGTGASTGVDSSKMPWAINVTGSNFNDILYGDARNNVLSGGAGKDELHGMAGHDRVDGGIGDDKLFGEDGNDLLYGGDGTDALNGGAHNDEMHGGAGNDGFFGGGGDDRIFGDAGNDRIYGDGGNDVIRGGAGNDIMTGAGFNNGGARGANTYVWERADVVSTDGAKAGLDHITDFGVGDRLDFSGLVSPASAIQDAVRITDTAGGLVVAVDVGGTAGFVDVVVLDNVHGLTVEDLTHSGAIAV
jgi:Ca2+-binding RTX toxin-like protein